VGENPLSGVHQDGSRPTWDGSRAEFLASLDPGNTDDWVRVALGEPTTTKG